jgi:Cadherin domain
VTKQAGTDAGALDVLFSAPDKTFDYLAVGEKLTLSYTLAIDDHKGSISTQPVIFEIAGSNDAPVITTGGGGNTAFYQINEDAFDDGNLAVARLGSSDPDHGDNAFWSIVGNPAKSPFKIDASTGLLSFKPGVDPEDNNAYTVIAKVTDSHGASDTQTVMVKIVEDDTYKGTANADTFVFWSDDGSDKFTVKLFDPVHDILEIDRALVGNGVTEAQFLADHSHFVQKGTDLLINLQGPGFEHDQILLKGTQYNQLAVHDFLFV